MDITKIKHPEYDANLSDWVKWNSVLVGGSQFINDHLVTFSLREDPDEFAERKSMSYAPSHAKAALWDIKNSIFQQMGAIQRNSQDQSYVRAIMGQIGGVDYAGSNMANFINRNVLLPLLSLGKVGVYIDKDVQSPGATLKETLLVRPYLYTYSPLDIRSWAKDNYGNLTALLLRDQTQVKDGNTGLITENVQSFRLLEKVPAGVSISFYDGTGKQTGQTTLGLSRIPFVIFELSSSLLADVADHQIALLNLASADMSYAMKANFPFYTEQFNPASMAVQQARKNADGTTVDKNTVATGPSRGVRYPNGLERPGFINPSPDPLRVSMEKQQRIKDEIYQLINLSVTALEPTRASAESKSLDNRSLDAGLTYIGMALEHGEQSIAEIWADYSGIDSESVSVKYPTDYSLQTRDDQRTEADGLVKLMTMIPSATFQKAVAKQIVKLTIDHATTSADLTKIDNEIDSAQIVATDPEGIRLDHEAGFVSTKTASLLRGYAEGETEQAAKDHAERAARVALAQSSAGARGVADLSSSSQDAKNEKQFLADQGKGQGA